MSNDSFKEARNSLTSIVAASKASFAAIEYAIKLNSPECKAFLELWLAGEFNEIRLNFKGVPDSVLVSLS